MMQYELLEGNNWGTTVKQRHGISHQLWNQKQQSH